MLWRSVREGTGDEVWGALESTAAGRRACRALPPTSCACTPRLPRQGLLFSVLWRLGQDYMAKIS
jgi:hypothetical protein